MLLDLTQIRQPETELIQRYQPSQFEGREAARGGLFRLAAPVDLRATIHQDKVRFRLVGTVSTVLELTCSRCVEPFALPLGAAFDLRYSPHTETDSPEREVEEDDLAEAFYRDDVIDLGQLMEEQFYLALPMKPLCQADCKGLCANCGTNLNVAACDCQVRWEDPRLAVLKAFIDRTKEDA